MSANAKREGVVAQGWEIRLLGEVVKPTRPRIKPSEKPDLPFIGMEHVEAHTMKLLGTVPAGTMKSSAVHFQSGDVLYGRLRPYLNKVYRPNFEGLCSAEFIVFPKTEGVDSRYLQYFMNSSTFVSFASHLNTGDRPRVDFDQLALYEFPLAPFDQQKRIVAEIEKQFSRLDEAVANLKRVRPTSSATKRPSSKPPSKAASSKPKPNSPAAKAAATRLASNSCNASSQPAAASGKARANTKNPPSPTPPTCPNCQMVGLGAASNRFPYRINTL